MNHARLLKLAKDLDHLPKNWKWDYTDVDHCAYGRCSLLFPADQFFIGESLDLTDIQERHIFLPGKQSPEKYGGTVLGHDASAKAVAANIRAMVRRDKEKQKCK